jgi:hypothetical protein
LELRFCDAADKHSATSLTQAIADFDERQKTIFADLASTGS